MNHDEEHFGKKLQRFSVVEQCPRCGKLSLSVKGNAIYCESCGYKQDLPSIN